MQSHTQDELVELIKSHDLKYTDHRFAIVSRIAKAKVPVAAHKIIEDLQKKLNIDQATIYRNLKVLEESGLVRRYDYNHGHAHYEIASAETAHQIVCSNCETIERIHGDYFADSIKKVIRKSKKFNTTNHANVEVYGVCKNCE